MYNSTDSNGSVLGATTAVAGVVTGVAVLPNTGGNTLATIFSVVAIAACSIVLTSFVVTRVIARTTK